MRCALHDASAVRPRSADSAGTLHRPMQMRATDAGVGVESAEALWGAFRDRVRENLRVVLAMSPIGTAFRDRTRKYPSLVSCTTMDWFREWPAEALQEVALKVRGPRGRPRAPPP